MKLTISLAQIDIVFGEPAANLEKVRVFSAEAARRGSDWVIFPELWSTAYDLTRAQQHATTTDRGIFAQVATIAEEYGIHIAGSCLSDMGAEQVGNTLTWHDSDGNLRGEYSKLHLFQLMDEHLYLTGGNTPACVPTQWGEVGLAICYDLRFPELFRQYALAGSNIIILPAEWPYPRLKHWRTLLRARAIENQLFIVACNRVGFAGDTHFFGHSAIIDPWGETVVEAGDSEILLTATIDTSQVAQVRNKIPIFQDRRTDIYTQSN